MLHITDPRRIPDYLARITLLSLPDGKIIVGIGNRHYHLDPDEAHIFVENFFLKHEMDRKIFGKENHENL